MRPRWLHLLLFALFLAASVAILRFSLATAIGMVLALVLLAARLLWFLYRLAQACTTALWSLSGELAERFEEARQDRAAAKEARHAARLL